MGAIFGGGQQSDSVTTDINRNTNFSQQPTINNLGSFGRGGLFDNMQSVFGSALNRFEPYTNPLTPLGQYAKKNIWKLDPQGAIGAGMNTLGQAAGALGGNNDRVLDFLDAGPQARAGVDAWQNQFRDAVLNPAIDRLTAGRDDMFKQIKSGHAMGKIFGDRSDMASYDAVSENFANAISQLTGKVNFDAYNTGLQSYMGGLGLLRDNAMGLGQIGGQQIAGGTQGFQNMLAKIQSQFAGDELNRLIGTGRNAATRFQGAAGNLGNILNQFGPAMFGQTGTERTIGTETQTATGGGGTGIGQVLGGVASVIGALQDGGSALERALGGSLQVTAGTRPEISKLPVNRSGLFQSKNWSALGEALLDSNQNQQSASLSAPAPGSTLRNAPGFTPRPPTTAPVNPQGFVPGGAGGNIASILRALQEGTQNLQVDENLFTPLSQMDSQRTFQSGGPAWTPKDAGSELEGYLEAIRRMRAEQHSKERGFIPTPVPKPGLDLPAPPQQEYAMFPDIVERLASRDSAPIRTSSVNQIQREMEQPEQERAPLSAAMEVDPAIFNEPRAPVEKKGIREKAGNFLSKVGDNFEDFQDSRWGALARGLMIRDPGRHLITGVPFRKNAMTQMGEALERYQGQKMAKGQQAFENELATANQLINEKFANAQTSNAIANMVKTVFPTYGKGTGMNSSLISKALSNATQMTADQFLIRRGTPEERSDAFLDNLRQQKEAMESVFGKSALYTSGSTSPIDEALSEFTTQGDRLIRNMDVKTRAGSEQDDGS